MGETIAQWTYSRIPDRSLEFVDEPKLKTESGDN